MKLQLPELLRRAMTARCLGRLEIVRRMGYRNTSKGLRRLDDWMRGSSRPDPRLVGALARALEISESEIRRCIVADRQAICDEERKERAKNPYFYVYWKWLPLRKLLPGTTEAEAIEVLRQTGRKCGIKVSLDMPSGKIATYFPDSDRVVVCG